MNGNPKEQAVTARILFSGVMMACINQKRQYEVGMVQCPNHEPTITVLTQHGSEVTEELLNWPAGHDLLFNVINPDEPGVSKHPTTDKDLTFNRVIDLEGPDMYNGPVDVDTPALRGRRVAVTAGKLYTDTLTPVDFSLVTWTKPTDPGKVVKVIGKVAEDVGLNIVCGSAPHSGIHIIDIATKEVIKTLPGSSNQTYEILIDNDCRKGGGGLTVGSDFRYLYERNLVSSTSGVKYDLAFATPPEGHTQGMPPASPDACENTFLSLTDTLGFGT
jgi:hypothetical protein